MDFQSASEGLRPPSPPMTKSWLQTQKVLMIQLKFKGRKELKFKLKIVRQEEFPFICKKSSFVFFF